MTSAGELHIIMLLNDVLASEYAQMLMQNVTAVEGSVLVLTDEYQREFVITVKESMEHDSDGQGSVTRDVSGDATDFVVGSSRYAPNDAGVQVSGDFGRLPSEGGTGGED